MTLSFMSGYRKNASKMKGVVDEDIPPRYGFSSGNYAINRITSGNFREAGYLEQGRIGMLSGPSGAGKSYLVANAMREAQAAGAFVLALDSENALDKEFVTKIGVNVDPDVYQYYGVKLINQVTDLISTFVAGYIAEYESNPVEAPRVLIVIDSLDMLMTNSEYENFLKGVTKGDQGAKNKGIKAMLKTFVHAIKEYNITILCTAQCYKNQDPLNGEGSYIVSDAFRFAMSTILFLKKLKLKEGTEITGIRMMTEGFKTRFTQPFQKVAVEVPYSTGMDVCNGLAGLMLAAGILVKRGSRLQIVDDDRTWYERDIGQYAERLIGLAEERVSGMSIVVSSDDIEYDEDDVVYEQE